jgi:hypothetical protein
VTTSHDPSNDTEMVFSNAELIRAGLMTGPRLFSTGTILYGAETSFKTQINSYDDALMHLRRLKAAGAFSVKSYNQQRRDSRQMILKAARELQMEVVPEGGSLVYGNTTQIIDGHTGVEHALPVPVLYKDITTLFGKTGVGYTPTLIVAYGGINGEDYWYQHTNVWENTRLLQFVPRDVVDPRRERDDAGGRLQSHPGVAEREEGARRRRHGADGRARTAAGPWRALGDVDDGAGRHDQHAGARHGDDQRREVPRPRQRPRLHRSRQTRRPDRARQESAR